MIEARSTSLLDAIGTDFAGTVESVGKSVTQLQVGDQVFGGRLGCGPSPSMCVPEDGAIVLTSALEPVRGAAAGNE